MATLFPKMFRSFALCMTMLLCVVTANAAEKAPVLVGLSAEFGVENSISAQAIELGLRTAIAQINAAGGVLGGHPIELVTKDTRSIPARGISNIAEFASMPNLVAVFGGRFGSVILAQLPAIQEAKLPYLVAWAASDPIINNGMSPNYVFRLSLNDSLAMPKLLKTAQQRGFDQVGLLLVNNSAGNSKLAAAQKYMLGVKNQKIVDIAWFNARDTTLIKQYKALTAAGAKAVILVATDEDGAILVREVAALPPNQRVPIISHWSITGSDFFKHTGAALQEVDLSVIQTFSFFNADKKMLARFMKTAQQTGGIQRIEDIPAPNGVAQAYDLMHILAKAINLAGKPERSAIRDALEKVPEYQGLIKLYQPPFTATRHEALGPEELLMARYNLEGVLVPVKK